MVINLGHIKSCSKIYCLILISCISTLYFNIGFANTISSIAAGYYDNGNDSQPMLFMREGKSWMYKSNIVNLPSDMARMYISSTARNHDTYIVTGWYFDKSQNKWPLLLSSHNHGKSWTFINHIPALSTDLKNITVSSAACAGKICTVVGSNHHSKQPLLLSSQDGGKSWSLNRNITAPSSDMKDARLASINCFEKTCVAVGNYRLANVNPSSSLPLVIVSQNNGKSWIFIKNISSFTPALQNAHLSAVSCSHNLCVSVGKYHDSNVDKPLLITSHDRGLSWAVNNTISNFLAFQSAYLFTVNCSGLACVAGGELILDPEQSQNLSTIPLLISSNNGGRNWSAINTIKQLSDKIESSHVTQVACRNNICAAAGYYYKSDNHFHPLLLISRDKGQSWTFVTKMMNIPTDAINAGLSSIMCDDNKCTAVGYSKKDGNSWPLLLESHDKGESWLSINTFSGLSSKLHDGYLYSLA